MTVDATTCFEFEGHQIPWWPNTTQCKRCGTIARLRAVYDLLQREIGCRPTSEIYITEQVTPFFTELKTQFPHLVGSEFIPNDSPSGTVSASGVRCEDMCSLSFPEKSFDYVLTFEVLEHIADYQSALLECLRVLKPGGKLVITVPFHGEAEIIERCRYLPDGTLEHYLPPEYHGDPVNTEGVVCFRYFGVGFLRDLRAAGFSDAWILSYWSDELGYLGADRAMFVAQR